MKIFWTSRFKKDFKALPSKIQKRFENTPELLLANRRHPSLYAKKMEGIPAICEFRVTDDYRVTFQNYREGVLLRRIGTHDVLRNP